MADKPKRRQNPGEKNDSQPPTGAEPRLPRSRLVENLVKNPTFASQTSIFESLAADLPVLLLPVRFETRFYTQSPPAKLKIRIFPDQLAIDDHDERLSETEYKLGQQFWVRFEGEKNDPKAQAALWHWFVSKLGARRAPWVARTSRLSRPAPARRKNNEQRVAQAPLLPDRWFAVGYVEGNRALEAFSRPVAADLPFSPDLERVPAAPHDLSIDPELKWLFDFELALAKGMAIQAELNEHARNGLDELYVLGVKTRLPGQPEANLTPAQAAEQFEQLLTAQHYTRGGGFVPQGTPTNNTEETQAGWSAFDPDLEAIRWRELAESPAAPAGLASRREPQRGSLAPAKQLPDRLAEDDKNYRVLERAFGLPGNSVLKRFEYREGFEKPAMEAMNTLLWAVSWGEYLGTLLASKSEPFISPAQLGWIQDWFQAHVKGGAALPALRFGETPYGVLPVQSFSHLAPKDTHEKTLFDVLQWLLDKWAHEGSEGGRLLQLSEPDGQGKSPGEVLLELLSKQPNPVEFSTAHLSYDEGAIILAYEFVKKAITDTEQSIAAAELDDAFHELDLKELGGATFASIYDQWAAYYQRKQTLLEKQDYLRSWDPPTELVTAWLGHIDYMLGQVDHMLAILDDHQVRLLGLELAGVPADRYKGVLESGHADPTMLFCRYSQKWRRWPRNRLVIVPDGDSTVLPARYLEYLKTLAQSYANPSTEAGTSPLAGKDQPLLYQLIRTSITRVGTSNIQKTKRLQELIRSIDILKVLAWDQLELLLQQSLGLAGWRFDAWTTSFAAQRLEALREKRPAGLQLGAFGWVEDLRPRPADAPAAGALSQGFIHTPSLNHARTAAILRAGWHAYGTEDANSALAVNLSSDRVRTAGWLFEAIRQGQDLGDALGYRFERRLHERRLDYWVYPIRKAVLEHTQEKEDPRSPVVDGMELLNIWNGGKGKSILEKLTKKYFLTTASDVSEIVPILQDLDQAGDAMADAAMADSVHALAQGNPLRAGSSLAAISRGEVPPPELQVAQTTRRGMTLTHRVLLALPSAPTNFGWFGNASTALISPRVTVDPDLEHLAGTLLGSPDQIRFEVGYQDSAGEIRYRSELSLAELSDGASGFAIGALDLLAMTPANAGAGALGLWLTAYLGVSRPAGVEPSWSPLVILSGQTGKANLTARTLLWLQAWRNVIHQARAIEVRDFTHEQPAAGVEGEVAIEALERRAIALRESLQELLRQIDRLLPDPTPESPRPIGDASEAELREKLLALSRYNLPQAIPRVTATTGRPSVYYDQLWSAYRAARKKLKKTKRLTLDPSAESTERVRQARSLVQALLGKSMAVSVPLRPANFPEVVASLAKSEARLDGEATVCHEWLERIGYVRPALKQFSEALLIHDAFLRAGGGLNFAVAQLPDLAGEKWVALHLPNSSEQSRLSLLIGLADGIIIDPSMVQDGHITGLFIDELVERLPANQEDTGVTLHFDAPSTEPPQTMLLAVTPEGKSWDFDLMVDTLRDTLEMARLRSLDGDDIPDFDHQLPAVFASQDLAAGLEAGEEHHEPD
jgi:hypothetical protein